MANFIIYDKRHEEVSIVSDLKGFVSSHEADGRIVTDLICCSRFLSEDEAYGLMNSYPEDESDAFYLSFKLVSLLHELKVRSSISFDEKWGRWGIEVSCLEVDSSPIDSFSDIRTDLETGFLYLSPELQRISDYVDKQIVSIEKKWGEENVSK